MRKVKGAQERSNKKKERRWKGYEEENKNRARESEIKGNKRNETTRDEER